MAKKTYEQVIAGVRQDMQDDGMYGDDSVAFEIAQSLLDNEPGFKKLAQARFPGRSNELLVECVACTI